MAGDQITTLTIGTNSTSTVWPRLLETFEYSGSNKITSFATMFSSCFSLTSIPQLYTLSGSSFSATFQNCYNLKSLPTLDLRSATNISQTFQLCHNLSEVTLQNTQNVNNWNSTFTNCYNLYCKH